MAHADDLAPNPCIASAPPSHHGTMTLVAWKEKGGETPCNDLGPQHGPSRQVRNNGDIISISTGAGGGDSLRKIEMKNDPMTVSEPTSVAEPTTRAEASAVGKPTTVA